MNKQTIAIAIAAGLLGGVASHFLAPQLVHAESQTVAPKEVRAERFVLVNEKGQVLGTLCEDAGRPALTLFDARGQEIWSAGGKLGIRTASVGR
jgi:hypothetical protein